MPLHFYETLNGAFEESLFFQGYRFEHLIKDTDFRDIFFKVKTLLHNAFKVVLRHLGYFFNRVSTALHRSGTGVPI